jgi:hypothetical protein
MVGERLGGHVHRKVIQSSGEPHTALLCRSRRLRGIGIAKCGRHYRLPIWTDLLGGQGPVDAVGLSVPRSLPRSASDTGGSGDNVRRASQGATSEEMSPPACSTTLAESSLAVRSQPPHSRDR